MTGLPPNRAVNANDTDFEGYTAPPEGPAENVDYYQTVTADYLKTMGIPVVKGAASSRPTSPAAPVLLVNETLEKTFFTFASSRRSASASTSSPARQRRLRSPSSASSAT